ncbi:uncharacterized protein TNCV_2854601 [Trichonephila clavipes]|nr:uncharacterized protein TNCV_2854601 [Trichonephila clavipes]
MSRRKQRSAFDQVSEFDRGRIVAYRDIVDYLSGKSVVVLDETKQLCLRRQWCDERWMWEAGWNEVVFTDETRICLQHHDGRIRVWRHRGERILSNFVMHHHTGPAPGGIMVWGGIGYHSRTHSSNMHCWYFKEPALHLRGVGASCPSLPLGLGHSHISTG